MTKVEIGTMTFKAAHVTYAWDLTGPYKADDETQKQMDRIALTRRVEWDCAAQRGTPTPFPSEMSAEPHLLVYQAGFQGTSRDVASAQAGKDLLKAMGFADVASLNAALLARFGVATAQFDIDALIAPLKVDFKMRIGIVLRYMHFQLTNWTFANPCLILLSLPDTLSLHVTRVGRCTEIGPGQTLSGVEPHETLPVVAGNTLSWKMRTKAREEQLKTLANNIEYAKRRSKALKSEIEASKPEGD